MATETVLSGASAFLSAIILWVLSGMVRRIERLEDHLIDGWTKEQGERRKHHV